MGSPTTRTMDMMRKDGYLIGVVERFIGNGRFGFRKDFLGFIDLIAINVKKKQTVGVQTTSGSNFSSHVRKILDNEDIRLNAQAWLESGNEIQLHGWRKTGKAGKRKKWDCRVQNLTLEDVRGG